MAERGPGLLITCEHGGNRVPAAYAPLFLGQDALLDSHRGLDIGSLVLARQLASHLRAPLIVHVSVHTFAPVLDGVRRVTDVGLLYDPRRRPEQAFCAHWQQTLQAADRPPRVRRNYPYLGRADGLTTALRKRHGPARYLGVELEVNQAISGQPEPCWAGLRAQLAESLATALVAASA